MRGQRCLVRWADGYERTITWKHSWLVKLLFTGAFTQRDLVRVNPNLPVPLLSHLRHEATHSRQQAESGMSLLRWDLHYIFSSAFKRAAEEPADAARREWYENSVLTSDPTITVLTNF